MMMNGEIRKGKGIDDLVSGHIHREQEESRKILTEGAPVQVRFLMEDYKAFLDRSKGRNETRFVDTAHITTVLSPNDIQAFIYMTTRLNDHNRYMANAGFFITRLIRNSYEAGNNDFNLNIPAPFNDLMVGAYFGSGDEESPLKAAINGDIGENCGQHARDAYIQVIGDAGKEFWKNVKYSGCVLDGNAADEFASFCLEVVAELSGDAKDYCGWASAGSYLTIHGNVGDQCAGNAKRSTYLIYGDAGKWLGGNAEECTFVVHGSVGDLCGTHKYGDLAEGSTFKTPNKETLEKMMKDVPEGNRVVFIRDGKEDVRRDYDDKH